jgi:hypothetical protein
MSNYQFMTTPHPSSLSVLIIMLDRKSNLTKIFQKYPYFDHYEIKITFIFIN